MGARVTNTATTGGVTLPQRFSVRDSGGSPRKLTVSASGGYVRQELNTGDGFEIANDQIERYQAAIAAAAAEPTPPVATSSAAPSAVAAC